MRKGIYLENTPLADALNLWAQKIASEGVMPLEGEMVPVEDSLGRITAGAVFARLSSPFYHSSAMDGYAVRFSETFGASESVPKRLKLGQEAVYVDTGDPLPEGFNAVIMIEEVNASEGPKGKGHIEIITPAAPWQHVRVIGEDIVSTELIVPENHRMRPVDIGAVISGGHLEINVRRRPKVVIIPTGSEIVEPGTDLKKGDIIEYNSRILSSLVAEWGGTPVRFKPVPDDIDKIKNAVMEGCQTGDLVVINAGSSAGSEDFTAKVIAGLGQVILHGINIKPG
jgi:putative molybdopterin biosynthesis protein